MDNIPDENPHKVKSDFLEAAENITDDWCNDCPLLALAEPTNDLLNELRFAVDRANKAIPILNLAIKERDIEIAQLNNALNRHAVNALKAGKPIH